VNDYEREEARREREEEDRQAAELAILDIKRFARARCCLFRDEEDGEVLHGRLEGIMQEIDSLVVRDLRPGREKLQCRLLVAYDGLAYVCTSPSHAKCQACDEYKAMLRHAKRAAKKKNN
jgi:hypothetical protein